MLRKFMLSEAGAITTDYVVLTAGVVGIGIAAVGAASVGVENLAGNTGDTLQTDLGNGGFGPRSYLDDFEDGTGDWIGGYTDNSDGYFGGILGPFGGNGGAEAVSRTFGLVSGYGYAVIEFDLHAIDSWDGEQFVTYINGSPVSGHHFNWQSNGATGSWTTSDGNYNITLQPNGSRGQHGYSGWSDQSYSVRVEVADPGTSLSLGFGSTLNQSIGDESWGVDNVSVTSTNDPAG